MQDSNGNHLVPLPPVRVFSYVYYAAVTEHTQVEMTMIPVQLDDEARVCSVRRWLSCADQFEGSV